MQRFVSVISVAFVVAIFTPFAVAQDTSCKATISSLPAASELKGLRLGMTMEQVKAQVPQITFGPTDELKPEFFRASAASLLIFLMNVSFLSGSGTTVTSSGKQLMSL